jgi:DNA polymerase II small subunit/DNA polymerase delta subunit B
MSQAKGDTHEQYIEKRRAINARYKASEKGKACSRRWADSKKCKEYNKEYGYKNRKKISDYRRSIRDRYRDEELEYRKTPNARYVSYKTVSKQKGREFSISLQEYISMFWDKKCVYCGDDSRGGIDRIDSSLGYVDGNMAPCCVMCNRMKNKHSVEEFILHIKKVIAYFME